MKTTSDPHYPGYFVFGDGKGHGYGREKGTEAQTDPPVGGVHSPQQTRRNGDTLVEVLEPHSGDSEQSVKK